MTRHSGSNRFYRVIGCAICLLTILAMLGGHWMVLQSFAWARMVREASRHDSFATALARTFDSKHPCELCIAIQKGKASEKKSDQEKPASKIEGFLPTNEFTLNPEAMYPQVVSVSRRLLMWSEPPPTPPPRSISLRTRSRTAVATHGAALDKPA
jgi:hypothetical protein